MLLNIKHSTVYRKANWEKIEDKTRKTLEEIKDIENTSEVNSLWDTFKSTSS